MSPRAVRVLREVALIACEDTRHTARLCAKFDIDTQRVSMHSHNEAKRIPSLLAKLEAGDDVAVVSDAGTPLVSDPGHRFVRAAIEAGIVVLPIPGPSAPIAALVASGFEPLPFMFIGFLARKGRARTEWLERARDFPGVTVLFESPQRVEQTLKDLHRVLGDRQIVVARELTKKFEEMVRGTLGEITVDERRGEFTLVIDRPALAKAQVDDAEIDAWIETRLAEGESPRDLSRALAKRYGIAKSDAYARVLKFR